MSYEIRLTEDEFRLIRKLVIKERETRKSEVEMIRYICAEDERDASPYENDILKNYETLNELDKYLFHKALDN